MVVSKFLSRYVRCSSAKILLLYKGGGQLYTRLDFGYCYIHSQNLRHIDSREEYFHNDRMKTTVYNSKAPHINSASFSSRLSKMSHLHVKDKLAECPKATWFLSKGTWKCVSDSPPLCVSTTAPQNYDVCEYEMSHVLMPEFRPRITISRFLLSIG